ncbi:MAG: DNA polymerase III subunit [Planctomycetota bacterium]|jgi:DNA polymerase-3 subunit delta'
MDRILGQPHAIAQLGAALRAGRIHHAWILSGPRGVGKCTTALAVARILLDPDAAPGPDGTPASDPAGETGRLVDAGTHPDLHVVRKELALYSDNPQLRGRKLMNIPLDLLRERMLGGQTGDGRAHDAIAYRSAIRGHGKVFIIDEAELLDEWGQNALLKTLEEPPPATYLFLVTSRPERLLPTVRSRCQHVRFQRLDPAAMTRWLETCGLDVGPDERAWLTAFADGAPGMAQLAAEYGFHRWQQALQPDLDELDAGRYPADMGDRLAELVETFAAAWVKGHANASKDAANKDATGHLLTLLGAHVRARFAAACRAGEDPRPALEVIDLLAEAEAQLAANVNLKLALENLVVQWAAVTERYGAAVGSR